MASIALFSTSDSKNADVLLLSKVRELQIGLKCTEFGLKSASNVQLFDWLRQKIGLKCTEFGLKCTDQPYMYVHLRPIHTFEAEFLYI